MSKDNYQTKDLLHIPASSIMHRKYQAHLSAEIKKTDLLLSELPFIFYILNYGKEGILQDDIIKGICIAKSVATRTLQALEQKEYITREASKHSQRHKIVIPTKKILSAEKKLNVIMEKWHEKLTQNMSQHDKQELERLILIMGENARDLPF